LCMPLGNQAEVARLRYLACCSNISVHRPAKAHRLELLALLPRSIDDKHLSAAKLKDHSASLESSEAF